MERPAVPDADNAVADVEAAVWVGIGNRTWNRIRWGVCRFIFDAIMEASGHET